MLQWLREHTPDLGILHSLFSLPDNTVSSQSHHSCVHGLSFHCILVSLFCLHIQQSFPISLYKTVLFLSNPLLYFYLYSFQMIFNTSIPPSLPPSLFSSLSPLLPSFLPTFPPHLIEWKFYDTLCILFTLWP